ncbi:MAG: single-stranded DNA-binding protein [Bacteroidia bacterium]|nr:single-stranded DNA-binding protein [Bacteroidia bacterium]MDW8347049.1 single-stranded DNA-binding protein [Bacteroidia bacterium]
MADLKMPEINSVVVVGNLTKDPMFRETSSGTPVVNFTIASNRKYKDASGNWQEDVCYVGVVAWNKLAESCKNNLRRGSAVLIDGELQSRSWKTEDGHNRSVVEIKARRIQFLNKNYKKQGNDNNHNHFIMEEDEDSYMEDPKFLNENMNHHE